MVYGMGFRARLRAAQVRHAAIDVILAVCELSVGDGKDASAAAAEEHAAEDVFPLLICGTPTVFPYAPHLIKKLLGDDRFVRVQDDDLILEWNGSLLLGLVVHDLCSMVDHVAEIHLVSQDRPHGCRAPLKACICGHVAML